MSATSSRPNPISRSGRPSAVAGWPGCATAPRRRRPACRGRSRPQPGAPAGAGRRAPSTPAAASRASPNAPRAKASLRPRAATGSASSPPSPSTPTDDGPAARPAARRPWQSAELGPTSSAVISTLERCSPSSVSHVRCSSRPVTMTRIPLRQGEGHVLGQVPPADHVEERRRLLPLLRRAVLPAPVDRHPELGRGLTLLRCSGSRVPGSGCR